MCGPRQTGGGRAFVVISCLPATCCSEARMTLALPVIPTGTPSRRSEVPGHSELSHIAGDLRRLDVGQVRFGEHDRTLYAPAASIYQVKPLGVVVPSTADQVRRIVAFCSGRGLAVLPRGGGTSLAGQCTNRAVVIDLSAFCRRLIDLDVGRRVCSVEAGITIDGINRE